MSKSTYLTTILHQIDEDYFECTKDIKSEADFCYRVATYLFDTNFSDCGLENFKQTLGSYLYERCVDFYLTGRHDT